MKVLIVGYGNMGKTFANGFISSRFIKPEDIHLLIRNKNFVTLENGISEANIATTASKKLGEFDIVILAVKPQDFGVLAASIKPYLKDNQIIFSVMA
jgi:pyrroline-5-carboxylate reductase